MKVIATVGLPGSGKSEAAAVAREADIPVVTMGDVVRSVTEERGLDPTTDHGSVAQALRDEEGPGAIANRSIPHIERRLETDEVVFIDGIRSGAEVDRFIERFGDDFLLINVRAPFELRNSRISDRGRDRGADEGGESLKERDERELGFGMDEAIDRADVTVDNTGSLSDFHERIERIIESDRACDRNVRDVNSPTKS